MGCCANAPVVQIGKDVWEDLTPETFGKVLDGFASGNPPKPGSQSGRTASIPEGGPTTLTDPSLTDGSAVGSWQEAFKVRQKAAAEALAAQQDKPKG